MTTLDAPATPARTAIVPVNRAPITLRQRLESTDFMKSVAMVLPKHLTPERFVRVAITAMTRTPKLKQCDQVSFFQCLMQLSQFGLEPDGRRAHLIPFENRKRGVVECQLIIDWKGLVELVYRSGLVSNLHADAVCDNDVFEFNKGEIVKHIVNFKEPRGKAYAYYSVCRFRDGSEKCDVMTLADVEAIRRRSRAGNNGPWVTDFGEMAKKTVFRRLSKWLPLSSEVRTALDADDDQIDLVNPATTSMIPGVPMQSLEDVFGAAGDDHNDGEEADAEPPEETHSQQPTQEEAAQTHAEPKADSTGSPKPDIDLGDYDRFYELCEGAAQELGVPAKEFDACMKLLNAKTQIKSVRRKEFLPAREMVLDAWVAGTIDVATGAIQVAQDA